MKIDAYSMNQIQNLYGTQGNASVRPKLSQQSSQDGQTAVRNDAFHIRDTYEPAKEQVRVNFGGYDKNGRGGIARLSASNAATPVNNDFSTTKKSSATGTIVDGLSSVLNQSPEDTKVTMKNAGVAIEELVIPDRAKTLSEDPATQSALMDFATGERASLLAQTGMTGQELDNFVAAVR